MKSVQRTASYSMVTSKLRWKPCQKEALWQSALHPRKGILNQLLHNLHDFASDKVKEESTNIFFIFEQLSLCKKVTFDFLKQLLSSFLRNYGKRFRNLKQLVESPPTRDAQLQKCYIGVGLGGRVTIHATQINLKKTNICIR